MRIVRAASFVMGIVSASSDRKDVPTKLPLSAKSCQAAIVVAYGNLYGGHCDAEDPFKRP